jgi:SAM-dependent methyltransferase
MDNLGEMKKYNKVKKTWTLDSDGYDDLIQKQLKNKNDVKHWAAELSNEIGSGNKRVLDIGCGPGFFSIILSRLGYNVKAIDGSLGMVECAKRNLIADGKKANVFCEDATLLPNDEVNSYDAIISRDVVWTLYNPEKAFKRWKKLLKPGGKIIIYDGNYSREVFNFKTILWKFFAHIIILLTEFRWQKKTEHSFEDDVFEKLYMRTKERPKEDVELLKK